MCGCVLIQGIVRKYTNTWENGVYDGKVEVGAFDEK
jgi:hypothetical protein